MKLLLGFYFGIGDFISAVPMIRELSKRYDVTIAIGNQNKGLVNLVDLENIKILYFPLFRLEKIKEVIGFINQLQQEQFDKILVSPHAQDVVTSWKIPLMLRYIKSTHMEIIGANGDKNSFLYDKKIPIDKSIPLMQREIDFVKLSGLVDYADDIEINNIFKHINPDKNNTIVIHPGASRSLKEWDHKHYIKLVKLLLDNTSYSIVFIGLEEELLDLKNIIGDPKVNFFSGSFKEVIIKALQSDCIITMDSGFGHIASALGLNHFVLIGSANPNHIKPIFKNTKVINFQKLSCQPCNGHDCHIGYNYCMDLITPEFVYQSILGSL